MVPHIPKAVDSLPPPLKVVVVVGIVMEVTAPNCSSSICNNTLLLLIILSILRSGMGIHYLTCIITFTNMEAQLRAQALEFMQPARWMIRGRTIEKEKKYLENSAKRWVIAETS